MDNRTDVKTVVCVCVFLKQYIGNYGSKQLEVMHHGDWLTRRALGSF